MSRRIPKAQLRRCGNCQKIGHNKATCTTLATPTASAAPTPSPSNPVKFFVHHVPHTPHRSQHVVNLKEHSPSPWRAIQTEPPATPARTYQTYHLNTPKALPVSPLQNKPIPTTVPLPADTAREHTEVQPVTQEPRTSLAVKKYFVGSAAKIKSIADSAREKVTNSFKRIVTVPRVAALLLVLTVATVIPTKARSFVAELEHTKQQLVENSLAGFMALQNTTAELKTADFAKARITNGAALDHFQKATEILQEKHRVLQTLITALPVIGGEVTNRQKLLIAGQKIAIGNSILLSPLPETGTSTPLLKRITYANDKLAEALPSYESAVENLQAVDAENLPLEFQASFNDYRDLFSNAVSDLRSVHTLASTLQEIFGGHGQRRYLLVFQNENEIRATGGFMGSFAILDIKDGNILKLDIPAGGTYDLQGQLDAFVEPPSPLLLANKRWEFQDANWFPDFPASAEKILWFYRHARGRTADGVIAINSSVLTRLVELTGPIADTQRGIVLDTQTAIPTLQKIVENGPEKKDKRPKQILADLAPRFLEYFHTLKSDTILPLLITTQEALTQKEIQAYFTDEKTENIIKQFGWSGHMVDSQNKDYLYVVNTNINSGKSDASIKQTIQHQATVQDDGSIIGTVVISREHTGENADPLYGIANVNYVRVYVPKGSTLVSAQGFSWPNERLFRAPEAWYTKDATLAAIESSFTIDERTGTKITEEFGKTSFGNWVVTEPGETSRIMFSYRLPFTLVPTQTDDTWKKLVPTAELVPYQLVVQHQSGTKSAFESQILLPEAWIPTWRSGSQMTLAKNGAVIKPQVLSKDSVWSLLIKK